MNKNYIFNKKKNVILFIYDYACCVCGLISLKNHVHHVDKNHKNNDSFNLVPLSKKCHVIIHKIGGSINLHLEPSVINQLEQLNSLL